MYNLELLQQHLENNWGVSSATLKLLEDPNRRMSGDFKILEFPPNERRSYWIYSTLGMSLGVSGNTIELHVLSTRQDSALVELLIITASYHRNDASLGLHHTVNFGRPWQDESPCDYGFISLPYLDGEALELFEYGGEYLRNLWLIPITKSERQYKIEFGWETLEEKFEECGLDYNNPNREPCA